MAGPSSAAFFGMRDEDDKLMKQPHSPPPPPPPAAALALAPPKKRRNQPGNPSPDAEVIALSPKSLMATNRFMCEVCNKGFQREQNLQLHRRGHNLPWKLKQKLTNDEVKRKVYLCPEPSCIHHDPSRALGDLTGIKKHYSRKHGVEKKYKCEKCSKNYAVQSDWKAHIKTCGTKEYRCHCGNLFSRRDSFISHRAFCDALAQECEAARHPPSLGAIATSLFKSSNQMSQLTSHLSSLQDPNHSSTDLLGQDHLQPARPTTGLQFVKLENLIGSSVGPTFRPTQTMQPTSTFFLPEQDQGFHDNNNSPSAATIFNFSFFANGGGTTRSESGSSSLFSGSIMGSGVGGSCNQTGPTATTQNPNDVAASYLSATALLQKAAQMGSTTSNTSTAYNLVRSYGSSSSSGTQSDGGHQGLAASFLNVFGNDHNNNGNNLNELMNFSSNIFEGGSRRFDGMTRDFLGVGEIVRRSMSGGFLHRESAGAETSSSSVPRNQTFGGGNFQ